MKGYIYIIRSKLTDDIYYGSTKEPLKSRFSKHKSQYKAFNRDGSQNYLASFDILKYADACIELVEEIEFEDKKELLEREAFYIKNNPCVNRIIPKQTWKERYEKNKDHIDAVAKEYRQTHKEELKEKRKVYVEKNRDKVNDTFRDWAKRNKDDRKEYMKKWREENKDKLKQYEENRKKI
jgi:hypothetical protein